MLLKKYYTKKWVLAFDLGLSYFWCGLFLVFPLVVTTSQMFQPKYMIRLKLNCNFFITNTITTKVLNKDD